MRSLPPDARTGMIAWRHLGIDAGLRFLAAGPVGACGRRFAGAGAVLMLHRVLPGAPAAFAPNRGLQVTPAYLDAALGRLAARGHEFIALDEVPARLADPPGGRPFVAITLDDGARCLLDHALPVFERHAAPFTAYLTPGFLDRTTAPWWLLLEAAVARLTTLPAAATCLPGDLPAGRPSDKRRAFAALLALREREPEAGLRAVAARLAALAGVDAVALSDRTFLSWDGARRLAAHPLASVGAHTLTHPRLAELTDDAMRAEIAGSRQVLEARLGVPVRHLAYPYGDAASAGPREHAAAAALGFATAVTTRGGVLRPSDAARPTALPRVTLNGHHQSLAALDALVSGLPYALAGAARALRAAASQGRAGPPSSGSAA